MPRFAILRHDPGPRSTRALHWDLMFECGPVLRTFACAREPEPGLLLTVDSIADHRLAYLDYEGAVSSGRGDVACWDRGNFSVIEETPTRWRLDVTGQRWSGIVNFTPGANQRWTVAFEDPSAD